MTNSRGNKMKFVGFAVAALLCLQFFVGQAQFTSRLGKFQVDQIRGCAPFKVTITNTNLITVGECTSAKPCNMDFEKGQQQNLFTYIYTTPGTYKLSVLYQSAEADDITITVDPDIKPEFDIYTCSGSKVSIKITDKTYDQYLIDFNNDGTIDKTVPSGNNPISQFDYVTPGNYFISVKGKKNSSAPNCSAMIKPFTALALLPVAQLKTLTAIDKNTLNLNFTPATNIQYRLEIALNGTNNFQLYQTLYGVSTVRIPNLDLEKNYYCFRLSSYDACTGINNYSTSICSQILSLTIQSELNKLSWQSDIVGVSGVDVYRNKSFTGSKVGASLFYDDVGIVCNKDYCYSILVKYSFGATSASLEKCGRSFTTITPFPILDVSTVTGAPLDITWLPDALQKDELLPNNFSVLKTKEKAPFAPIGNTSSLPPPYSLSKKNPILFQDFAYVPQENTCYRINYTDACGNQSPDGVVACPIVLQGVLTKNNVITLNWNAYTGWKNGVKDYKLEKFSASGNLLATLKLTATTYEDAAPDPVYQVVKYKITATPNDATLTESVSNTLIFTKETNLYYPTAFSPNDDNLNDTFTVSGQYISKLKLSVFDRWGGLLFVSEKNEPWNGYANGKLQSEGAYVWKAEVTDLAGNTFSNTGTIFLITRQK